MSDGSIGKGVVEGIKGIVGGTLKAAGDEVAEVGKAAVGQVANTSQSNAQSQLQGQHAPTHPYKEPGNDQKIAQLRNKLHNEAISVTPTSSQQQQEQPRGPIAEQSFQSSHLNQFGATQTAKKQAIAVKNTRHEQGSRDAKG